MDGCDSAAFLSFLFDFISFTKILFGSCYVGSVYHRAFLCQMPCFILRLLMTRHVFFKGKFPKPFIKRIFLVKADPYQIITVTGNEYLV